MRIIGIMLVRDEDLFIGQAIRNSIGFCDELLVADHGSTDRTPEILSQIAVEYPDKLRVRQIKHPRESHEWIREYRGQNVWVFGVDGDEIYDPDGLAKMRQRLERGDFDRDWCVFGNVLNVRTWSVPNKIAIGHLAPPCRSMTKLYNFQLIDDWNARDCIERLHGGGIQFRPGFDATMRRDLYKETGWDESDFRCLHLCFLPRSSRDNAEKGPRKNIMDRHAWSVGKIFAKLKAILCGGSTQDWKDQRYGRGPLTEKSFVPFFPSGADIPL